MQASAARRGLLLYFAVVIIGTTFFEGSILRTGKTIDSQPMLVVGPMWTPALAMLVTPDSSRRIFGRVVCD